MNAPIIAFFNNKGGVGKTSLVYHLAWMYSNLGYRVVAVDLDPQANLTAAFIEDDRLEELWPAGSHRNTVFGCVQPLIKATGDIAEPHLEAVDYQSSFAGGDLRLLVGDLALSNFEDQLSEVWPKCMDGDERAFRVISAFWRMMIAAAKNHQADVVLMDLGPNLGAINRAALIATDYVVMPLAPDLFSLRGLQNIGPTLRKWRKDWNERFTRNPAEDLPLPKGRMEPIGYVVLQHAVRFDRPVKAYERWIGKIPHVYRSAVLDLSENNEISVAKDKECLALMKNYQSLMPLSQECRKPMFHLKPADGATGSRTSAVKSVYGDFKNLALKIAERTHLKPLEI